MFYLVGRSGVEATFLTGRKYSNEKRNNAVSLRYKKLHSSLLRFFPTFAAPREQISSRRS